MDEIDLCIIKVIKKITKWLAIFFGIFIVTIVILTILRFIFIVGMIEAFKNMECCEGKPETNVNYVEMVINNE